MNAQISFNWDIEVQAQRKKFYKHSQRRFKLAKQKKETIGSLDQ